MRSDEAVQVALGPTTPKDFDATATGFNDVSVANGASLVGNWVDVRGYRRVGIAIQSVKTFTFFLLGQVGSLQSDANIRYNTTAITNAGGSNIYCFVADVCCDAVAIMISNTDAASGAFTVMATALP
jgi:hypothetical protein